MFIYITLNFGNRNKLIKQKVLFIRTIFSDFSHQSCLQLEEKLFFIKALEEVNYVTCSLKIDRNHCILVSILKHLRQILKCAICVAHPFSEVYFVVVISFCGLCLSSIVLLPSDRYFSAVMCRMVSPSSKCSFVYSHIRQCDYTFQVRVSVKWWWVVVPGFLFHVSANSQVPLRFSCLLFSSVQMSVMIQGYI